MMTAQELLARLREADDADVTAALDGGQATLPLSEPHDLIDFFNRMLDVLSEVEEPNGD